METGNMQHILSNYGYHEPLPDDAVPLVSHMASDLADMRMQLSQNKRQLASLESTTQYQKNILEPLQADNQQLLAENNELYMRLHEMQDAQAMGYSVPEPVPLVHRGPHPFAAELHALESEVRNLRAFGAEVVKREDNLKTEVSHLKHKNRMLESQLASQSRGKKNLYSSTIKGGEDSREVTMLNSKLRCLEAEIKRKDKSKANVTEMLTEKDKTIALLRNRVNVRTDVDTRANSNNDDLREREPDGASDTSYNSTHYLLTQRSANQITPRPIQPMSVRSQVVMQDPIEDDDGLPNCNVIPEPYQPMTQGTSSNGLLSGFESDNLTAPSTSSDGSINRPIVSTATVGTTRPHISMSPEHDVATSKIYQTSGNLYGAENVHSSRYSRSSSPNTVHPCSMGPRHSTPPQTQAQQVQVPVHQAQMHTQPQAPAQHPLPYNMQVPNPGCVGCARLTSENAKLKHQISSLTSENLQLKVSSDTSLTNRDKYAMQMQSEVQERDRVISSLQTEIDTDRNQIAVLRKENSKLQAEIERQQAEIAELTSANAVITTFSSKLEQKVADNIDASLKMKEVITEYETNMRLSAEKIKENAKTKRALEKQLVGERDKIAELKARVILDQETIKRLNETNKKLSKMMAQVVIENRQLRQVMTVDEVEDYVDVEKGFGSTVQPSALGASLMHESTRRPITISVANDLLKSALETEDEKNPEECPENYDVNDLLQHYINKGNE